MPEPAEPIKLSLMDEETLKEVGNVGAAKAADKISRLTGIRTTLNVPYIQIVSLSEVYRTFIGTKEVVVSAGLKLFGKYPGLVLVVYKNKTACCLLDEMFKRPTGTTKKLEREELSAFLENSNIIINSYISALADFFEAKFVPEPPRIVIEVDKLFQEFAGMVPSRVCALVIGTEFSVYEQRNLEGFFILLLSTESLNKLLEFMRQKAEGKGKVF